MPDAVKTSSWKRRFKTHDKAKRRLLTGAEVAERDANTREQETGGETRGPLREKEVSDSPHRRYTPLAGSVSSVGEEEEETEEEEEEEEEDPLIPPPSTAPPALTVSRAGRKRAPTMKALEAEKAPKRGDRRGRGRGAKQ